MVEGERELAAAPGRHRGPLDPDDVADVEVDEQLVGLLAEQVLPRVELDLAAAVAEVQEARLAVTAAADDAAGDAVAGVRLHPGCQPLVGGPDLGDVLAFAEAVGKWVDAGGADSVQLLAPVAEDVGELLLVRRVLGPLRAHGASLST